MCFALYHGSTKFEVVVPFFDLSFVDDIIAKGLLNLLDALIFNITQPLSKLDAISLLDAFTRLVLKRKFDDLALHSCTPGETAGAYFCESFHACAGRVASPLIQWILLT